MEKIDELRPVTAQRMLEIWRQTRDEAEEPLERSLLCNARILAESCFLEGEAVFPGPEAVLGALTTRQMEELLRQLAGGPETAPRLNNPEFSMERFSQLEA